MTDCQLLPATAAKRPCLNFVRLFVGHEKTNLKIKSKKDPKKPMKHIKNNQNLQNKEFYFLNFTKIHPIILKYKKNLLNRNSETPWPKLRLRDLTGFI